MAIVLTGAAVGFSLMQTPKYEASIQILVGQERGISETPNDAVGLQQLTQTMTVGLNSHRVADAVIRQEGLSTSPEDFLEEDLRVNQVPETQFIEVVYTDTDFQRAQRVANAVGAVFAKQIAEVSPSANSITATVWGPASGSQNPVSPNPLRNALAAFALGLMLGVGLAFLLEYLDDSWRSPEEVEQISGLPTYGVIPNFEHGQGTKGR